MKIAVETTAHWDALIEALDQYVANQAEHEEQLAQERGVEFHDSPKLAAARTMLDLEG